MNIPRTCLFSPTLVRFQWDCFRVKEPAQYQLDRDKNGSNDRLLGAYLL